MNPDILMFSPQLPMWATHVMTQEDNETVLWGCSPEKIEAFREEADGSLISLGLSTISHKEWTRYLAGEFGLTIYKVNLQLEND